MKTALITGGTKGMGRAISLALGNDGYNLIICARKQDELDRVAKEIAKVNAEVQVYTQVCDFSDEEQVNNLIYWVEKEFDRIDVLVNNVGLFVPGRFFDEKPGALKQHMQINVFAPHALSRAIGKVMKQHGSGHIFNITSVASREVVPTAASYSVTKFALAGLTNIIREELKKHGVKVTEIVPGSTLTSSWEGTTVPAKEFVLPEDIAKAVMSVLSMSEGANVDEVVVRPIKGQI